MIAQPDFHDVFELAKRFNQHFSQYNVVLKPGAAEPFYQSAKSEQPAIIFSSHDYFSSALHELSHWAIAGEKRLQFDDYGYWYAPDGRNAEQQKAFFKVEVKPQALEWAFSLASNIPFQVSLDNLDSLEILENSQDFMFFQNHVGQQLQDYFTNGFPQRGLQIIQFLCQLYRQGQPINLPNGMNP